MIRQKISGIIQNPKVHWTFYKLSFILSIVGYIYLLVLPIFPNSDNYIEENAVRQLLSLESSSTQEFKENLKFLQIEYKTFMENSKKEKMPHLKFLQQKFIEQNLDYYIQQYEYQEQIGYNIVAQLKARRSWSYECNAIFFEFDSQSSDASSADIIKLILTFIKKLQYRDTNYLSRDIIFVGLDKQFSHKSIHVKQFIELLNSNSNHEQNKIQCTNIRQAIKLSFEENFNSLVYKFFTTKGYSPDQDFYNLFNKILKQTNLNYRMNSQVVIAEKRFYGLLKKINKYFQKYLPQLHLSENQILTYDYFFNVLESTFFPNENDTQGYLDDIGIPTIGLDAVNNLKYDVTNSKDQIMIGLLKVLEQSNRSLQQLDETLHAGSTLYRPVNQDYSITISLFCLPLIMIFGSVPIRIARQYLVYSSQKKISQFWINSSLIFYIFVQFSLVLFPKLLLNVLRQINNSFDDFFKLSESTDDQDRIRFSVIYIAGVIILTVVLNKLKNVIIKCLFQQKYQGEKINEQEKEIFLMVNFELLTGFQAIYWSFFNQVYMILILLTQPLIALMIQTVNFETKKNAIKSIIQIVPIYFFSVLIRQIWSLQDLQQFFVSSVSAVTSENDQLYIFFISYIYLGINIMLDYMFKKKK